MIDFVSAQQPQTNFAIVVEEQPIGGIGLEVQQDILRISAEICYWLGEPFWGRGIATAAIRELSRWAMPSLGLSRLYALPFAQNAASCRVLEKAGYVQEGILKKAR